MQGQGLELGQVKEERQKLASEQSLDWLPQQQQPEEWL